MIAKKPCDMSYWPLNIEAQMESQNGKVTIWDYLIFLPKISVEEYVKKTIGPNSD